jgi:hypothetical protein
MAMVVERAENVGRKPARAVSTCRFDIHIA